MRQADLGQLDLGASLQLAALEDPGDLGGDRAQEVDVSRVELAPLSALHVDHTDQARTRFDRHRRHGVKSVFVQPGHPLPVRLLAHVRHHCRPPRLGNPTGDALSHLHGDLADHVLVETVGGGEQELAAGQQVEGADIRVDGGGGLSDDQLEQSFDLGYHLKHVDTIFKRVFGE